MEQATLFGPEFGELTKDSLGTPVITKFLRELADDICRAVEEVEESYGPRDRRYRLRQVHRAVPQAVGLKIDERAKEVAVALTCQVLLGDRAVRTGYLAHEAVHLLDPVSNDQITYLEEGAAECFAIEHVARNFGLAWSPSYTHASYTEAKRRVACLLETYPSAIRTLRAVQPSLSKIDAGAIQTVCPNVPASLAMELGQRFVLSPESDR